MKNEPNLEDFRQTDYVRKAGEGFEYEAACADDLESLLTLAVQSARGNGICKYPNTPEGLALFKEKSIRFLEYVRAQNRIADDENKTRLIPSVEAWGTYCGISRQTILEYQKQRSQDWKDFVIWMKNTIQGCKSQLATLGRVPPIIYIFDSVNNSGYQNTSSITVQPIPEKEQLSISESPESIAQRYRAALADNTAIDKDKETAENTLI